jgi:hypothetical protein
MKAIYIFVLICLLIPVHIYSQEELKPLKWVVRPSFGITLPITTLSGGYITDDLVGFESNTYYWQFISAAYFFNNWGIEFSFAGNNSSTLDGRNDRFVSEVENKYAGNYYVTASSAGSYSDINPIGGAIEKGSIGPVYKIEKQRLVLIMRAMIGVTSFDTDWGAADLKEKGTNELVNIDWSIGRPVKDFFTFNPSFTFGYRVLKRIVLDLDLNYWIYNINFHYTETTENMNTHEIQSQKYSYVDLINEVSFGIGLMIVLK